MSMNIWSRLPRSARAECLAYGLFALSGLIGTQLALFALIRDAEPGLITTIWNDLTATPTAVFASIDLVVVFGAALIFMVVEGRRIALPKYLVYVALSVVFAISVGLPAFLLARRVHLVRHTER